MLVNSHPEYAHVLFHHSIWDHVPGMRDGNILGYQSVINDLFLPKVRTLVAHGRRLQDVQMNPGVLWPGMFL
jgi:hypothetical protein